MSFMSASFHQGGAIKDDPRAKDAMQRWGEITRLLQMAELDLMQIVASPASPSATMK